MLKINLITKTYNNSKLVEYFFRHYDQFVTNYFIWDNISTDNTVELLAKNPKATIFYNTDKEFDDYAHMDFKNNKWKKHSDCDLIINCDFDEFLYHPNMMKYLEMYLHIGIQIFRTEGYQMFYENSLPESSEQIYEIIKTGVREPNYDKPIIFSPKVEPLFSFGAHKCFNNSATFSNQEIKLLHYKVIGKEFINEIIERNNRLSERNKAEGLSVWSEEKGHQFNAYEVFESLKQNAIKIL